MKCSVLSLKIMPTGGWSPAEESEGKELLRQVMVLLERVTALVKAVMGRLQRLQKL
jgi:hypothetical protein